jgi:sirohydrochlorin ferrochelatase
MAPALPEVIDELATDLCDDIRIVPLFLAPGSHTERDLPALLHESLERWPELRFHVEPTLTEREAFHEAIVDWVDAGGPAALVADERVARLP